MRSHGSSPHWGQRRGFTLAEMLVTMVITSIVIAGGVSVFLTMQRAREQQAAVQDIQAEAHSVVEQLVRLVRNADSVATSSTDSRLEVIGGITQIACDAPVCWIEASSADGLRIGPEGGPGGGGVRQPDEPSPLPPGRMDGGARPRAPETRLRRIDKAMDILRSEKK